MCEGATTWQVWRHIVLPLVVPHIAAATILALLSALGNFGIPALLGHPRPVQHVADADLPAGRVALNELVWAQRFAGIALWFAGPYGALVQSKILGKAEQSALGDAGESRLIYSLGRWRLPVKGLLLTLILLCIGGPLFSVAANGAREGVRRPADVGESHARPFSLRPVRTRPGAGRHPQQSHLGVGFGSDLCLPGCDHRLHDRPRGPGGFMRSSTCLMRFQGSSLRSR